MSADVQGEIVTDFLDGPPAADAELQRGDVIEQVDRQPLRFLSDYARG